MKFLTKSLIMGSLVCSIAGFARGDSLRLRNGIEFVGHYIGGTKTEIWFQRDGMVSTTEVIPTSLVEGLKFEPGAGSPVASIQAPGKWMVYLKTVLATAWLPYASSTRTASVTSPATRAISMR